MTRLIDPIDRQEAGILARIYPHLTADEIDERVFRTRVAHTPESLMTDRYLRSTIRRLHPEWSQDRVNAEIQSIRDARRQSLPAPETSPPEPEPSGILTGALRALYPHWSEDRIREEARRMQDRQRRQQQQFVQNLNAAIEQGRRATGRPAGGAGAARRIHDAQQRLKRQRRRETDRALIRTGEILADLSALALHLSLIRGAGRRRALLHAFAAGERWGVLPARLER